MSTATSKAPDKSVRPTHERDSAPSANLALPCGHPLQKVRHVGPGPGGKLTRRETGIDPRQNTVLRKPELPLIAAIVALGAEHELVDPIVEAHGVEQVEFDSLHRGCIGGGWNVEPEVPKEIRAFLKGVGRMLPVEETIVVLT